MAKSICHNILVVDDNTRVRNTLVEALRYEGYQVTGAKDGREALQILNAHLDPTLIFLDLMMPGMNGWDFLKELQSQSHLKDHVVITISAISTAQNFEDSRPLEADETLRKPFKLEEVLEKVERLVRRPENLRNGNLANIDAG